MTTITAINCSNGIVIGADSQRSVGSVVGYPVNKILMDTNNNMIVSTSGDVGLGDKFKKIVKQYPNIAENQNKNPEKGWMLDGWVEKLSHIMIEELKSLEISLPRDDFSAILGYVENGVIKCQMFDGNILPSPIDGFDSSGSGMIQALPFLKHILDTYSFNHMPVVSKGILFTYWAIKHSIDASPGHVGYPIRISMIWRGNENQICTRELTEEEIQEYCEKFIRELKDKTVGVFEILDKEFQERIGLSL